MYVIQIPGKGYVNDRFQELASSNYYSVDIYDAHRFRRLQAAYNISQLYLSDDDGLNAVFIELRPTVVQYHTMIECANRFWSTAKNPVNCREKIILDKG